MLLRSILLILPGYFLILQYSVAQSYHTLPEQNAFWSVLSFDENNLQFDDVVYTIRGDSILHGKTYSVIYRLNDYPTIYDTVITLQGFIRQDIQERKVYFIRSYLGETSEKLGYDFTAGIGDTLFLPAFDYGNVGDSIFIREQGYCDSIQLLNGEFRKMYFYRSLFSAFSHEITFIEGIGDFYSTFPDRTLEFDAFHYNQSSCVELDNQLIWSWLSPADPARCGFNSLGINEKTAEDLISLYPDPADVSLKFCHPEMKEESGIWIFSMDGQLVLFQEIPSGSRENIIAISCIPPGFYLLRFQNREICLSRKIRRCIS